VESGFPSANATKKNAMSQRLRAAPSAGFGAQSQS
jgi:hypothetical protein